jgi:hypothetical protein
MATALTYPFSRLTEVAAEIGVTPEQLEALSDSAKRLKGEQSRLAIERRRSKGETVGRPRVISEAAYVRAQTLEAEGLSYVAIAETLTAEGHTRGDSSTDWTRHAAARLLARRRP